MVHVIICGVLGFTCISKSIADVQNPLVNSLSVESLDGFLSSVSCNGGGTFEFTTRIAN